MKELQDIDLKALIEAETEERFNKEGYIKCPFHIEKSPSLSIKFFPDRNKYKFKCWGCKEQGDALDFIMKFRKLGYKEAREYLDMENKKSFKEDQMDKVKNYIQWQIENTDYKRGYKLLGIFQFVNQNNEVIYYKAKLLKPDGKKETPYYHIEEDKVINKRGPDEVPYNLHNVLDGIKNQKTIIFVEGEKDANTINSILKDMDYVVTSIKGCKNLDILKNGFKFKIHVIGDTGEAGEQYKWHIYREFNSLAMEFKFINLPGVKALGDNKDVTDWLDAGHDKKDLLNAFDRSLDIKSTFELQQDKRGIYKLYPDKTGEDFKRHYLTDFQLLEAKRLRFIEDDTEGVKLTLKSCTNDILEKLGPSSVFDDVKSFKNFLGTLDLAFKGKADDVTDLKSWINKYFALENEERYLGVKFVNKNDKLVLITGTGAMATHNGIDYSLIADNSDINIIDKESISTEELIQLKKRIFKFAAADKTIPIVGTVINDLAVYQNEEAKENLNHLLIVGESGSGKTTILENVVAPMLNYPLKDKKSIGMITNFAMIRDLSTGNYPSIYDEFKPSMMDRYKILKLSDIFRNLYDRQNVARGSKSFQTNKEFRLTRPLIMAGEESYPNSEKASVERSCIVYLSQKERTKEHTEVMKWITKNEDLLNKFGKSIIEEILNLSVEQYKEMRSLAENKFSNLSNRVLTTAINVATGIEIFNILLERHGLKKLENYEHHIFKNIKEEILDGGTETKSTIEQMLVLYNNMIDDGRAITPDYVIIERGDGLFIRTSEMINQICAFIKQVDSAEVVPIKLKDFRKQATKAGYLLKPSSRQLRSQQGGNPSWYDEYSKDRMRKLNVYAICKPELEQIPMSSEDTKIIEGVFSGAYAPSTSSVNIT